MFIMPHALPEGFSCEIVAVAHKDKAPIIQISRDFDASPTALHRWKRRYLQAQFTAH